MTLGSSGAGSSVVGERFPALLCVFLPRSCAIWSRLSMRPDPVFRDLMRVGQDVHLRGEEFG
jgi:hypothetical protein